MIRYDIQKGVEKIKTKTFFAISAMALVLGGGAMSLATFGSAHAVVAPQVVYDSLASVTPQTNYPSQPFQAQQTNEFGDYVHLAGTARQLNTVTLTMSNWALQSTAANQTWCASNTANCDATGYNIPVTVNIYANTLTNDVPNHILGTKTVSVHVPWRPEGDSTCGSTSNGFGWKVGGTCFNYSGLAFNASLDLNSLNLTLPNDVIVGFVYNTQSYGPAPTGVDGPYNSLNIAVPDNNPVTVGSDDSVDSAFWNTSTASYYTNTTNCHGGTFCRDTNWTPNGTVAMQITALNTNPVKVQIFKYVDGAQATAANANSTTFPMTTTFTSPNLGSANNAPFTLSPTPWGGIGQPYEADFIGSVAGADYTASEVTTGNTVVSTACDSTTPYALNGYSFGSDLAQAQNATKTTTAPQFTNLQSDQVMIVWNKTCHNVKKPVITYPVNGATKTTVQMDKVDWTNVTGATSYEYQSFTDAAYTAQAYDTTVSASQIPTPGTPPGNYYLQVRAIDASGDTSPWSNNAANPYVVHVVALTTPPTTKDQCRNNGWKTFNNPSYRNKDKCIDYVVNHGHKVSGDISYTANGLKRSADFDMNTYDTNKGDFEYSDASHTTYKVKVYVVKVSGNNAWFAGVVTKSSNHSFVGLWLFAKVHNGNPDQISGSFTDQATATAAVNSMNNPADGPFTVTKGNLKVN